MKIGIAEFTQRMLQEVGNQTETMFGDDRPHSEWWDELKELLDEAADGWTDQDGT